MSCLTYRAGEAILSAFFSINEWLSSEKIAVRVLPSPGAQSGRHRHARPAIHYGVGLRMTRAATYLVSARLDTSPERRVTTYIIRWRSAM